MIVFPENISLEDERVLLRPLQENDIEFFLPFAMNEPETWYYSLVSPAGEEGMKKYISTTIRQRAAKKEYPFIVFDKKENKYAGSTRFYDIQLNNLSTQLGYTWYGKEFRRSGLNRHCKLLMLTYAFENWGMERVEFRADARNEKSVNAMKAIGCVVEGILRSHSTIEAGGRRDSIILSILKNEWFGGVKQRLIEKIDY
ncbi:MAG: GNAT family N-acetyltransferase [Bacteroidetes bacterium]|nr:GNAT family N-acetyltransferase [Bacteroidota bacterium]